MKITELLNIKYPIFQGAMAHIANASLASAVSNAGALGIIASGGMNKESLSAEIKKCKELTDKPFAVNLMLMAPNIEELVECVIENNIKIVTTGAGSPKKYIGKLKEANIKVIPVVATPSQAVKMEALGVDAIVCEGCEAGGHIGNMSTLPLVQGALSRVNIPVIAAGGIYNHIGFNAMLSLGCSGVQMGTVFLLANECTIDSNYKKAIKEAESTVVTGRTIGIPIRALPNKMTEKYIALEKQGVSKEELEHLTLGSLRKAVAGDIENGSAMAGEIVVNVYEENPVKEIIEEIVNKNIS